MTELAAEGKERRRGQRRRRRRRQTTVADMATPTTADRNSLLDSHAMAAGIQRAQETRATLNFYYQMLAELYETQKMEGNKWKDIMETKLKICEIHKKLMHGVMVRARVPTIHEEERCALYHLVKEKRKSRIKYIEQLRTAEGKIANTSKECIKEVEEFFYLTLCCVSTSQKATADILKSVNRHLSLQQQQDLQSPITEEEIRLALEGAPKNTAPGPDGLTYQVYKNHLRLIKEYLIELMNYILDTGSVIDGFSDGVVTLIPKTTHPTTVSEYRPITLLNTDYKLFMKTCGVPEKSIIHNLATIRDTVLYFEEHHDDKGALLSVDFNKAFDRVNHLYLQRVMECFCIPDKIISVIKNIYRTAHSRIQVNGFFTQRIPIQASIRQGCPLSMFLFALSVEPLIRMVHQNLNSEQRTTCPLFTSRVYADDVLFLLRDADDCVTLPHILETYSAASCAQLNTQKSFLIPLGSWPDGLTFNEITTVRQAKMLGMTVCNSFEEMVEINWTKTTALTRVTLFQQIHRNLNLFERVWHVNIFCLSKLWYLAQILPLPVKYATVLERAVSFYIWKGYLYKLKKAQLVLPKDK
ncbi:hypothetical protein ANN_19343 [Periplaneta americana]|uniref:Reverse transcriptase domain-containing protein n=1 Tax=Periplaneta americana TaxID=6978 RepID=A0ABQ8S9L4_PERAM|nr:hypothetical protein ANN_19343 [Periplaneta americana]